MFAFRKRVRALLHFRSGLRSIAGIEHQLERIATAYEAELAARGVILPESKPPQGEEPVFVYTDEEADFVREVKEKLGVRPA